MGAAGAVVSGGRQVQMNTRIDERLKELGDDVLRRMGYTPSAAVRSLWRYVVGHQDDAASIHEVLGGGADGEEARRRGGALAAQRREYERCAQALGISGEPLGCLPTWDELRDGWYEERLTDGGGA